MVDIFAQIASNITLGSCESKVIVSDYHFGENSMLLYFTASILFASRIGLCDVVFLYSNGSQEHEASFILQGPASIHVQSSLISFTNTIGPQTIVTFLPGISELVTIFDSPAQLMLFMDVMTAGMFCAAVLLASSSMLFANFWGLGSNETLLVGGPHLVCNVSLSSGSTLALHGTST